MTLPDFLVIGAARAGTTWLDTLLRTHPNVYLPTQRKEVHYFDKNYARGQQWYSQFFPSENNASQFGAVGETTPRYLYEPEVPARIADMLPDVHLIAILRHPVDRVQSHYGLAVRDRAAHGDPARFIEENPHAIAMSRYGEQLNRYADLFDREQIHVIILEEAVQEPAQTMEAVGRHIGVDAAGFDLDVRVVNQSFSPRHPRTRAVLKRGAKALRNHGLDQVAEWGKRAAPQRSTGGTDRVTSLSPGSREQLMSSFADDVKVVEDFLGRPIPSWHVEAL